MIIWQVPIEPLPERYSAQWANWFPRQLALQKNVRYETINGKKLINNDVIKTGSFLDVYGTNFYKATQLQEIIELIYEGEIQDGHILFFHDLWFPGLEMLQYIRQGAGKKFIIAGILHAGTYDPYDFLSKQGMGSWGFYLENAWLEFVDAVFVATNFHKDLIARSRKVNASKIHVTGLPIYYDDYPSLIAKKENIVVFPHRLDSEKMPEKFDHAKDVCQKLFPNWQFIKTKDIEIENRKKGMSNEDIKKEYYKILAKSKIAVSFALQETWGIAQQEALLYGCCPLVPDRLSYAEMYPSFFKYRDEDEFYYKLVYYMKVLENEGNLFKFALHKKTEALKDALKKDGEKAISNMVSVLSRRFKA